MSPVNIDADLENADWTKGSWDIPATSVEELRTWLKQQGMTVEQFKRLPVYRRNMKRLEWLRGL